MDILNGKSTEQMFVCFHYWTFSQNKNVFKKRKYLLTLVIAWSFLISFFIPELDIYWYLNQTESVNRYIEVRTSLITSLFLIYSNFVLKPIWEKCCRYGVFLSYYTFSRSYASGYVVCCNVQRHLTHTHFLYLSFFLSLSLSFSLSLLLTHSLSFSHSL